MIGLSAKAQQTAAVCGACQARSQNPPAHICLQERLDYLATLPETERKWAAQWWWSQATGVQIPPTGNWDTWLLLCARGTGKTWTGSWQVIEHAWTYGAKARIGIVARTAAANDTVVVTTGPSGILTVSPQDFKPEWIPSRKTFVWPNGAQAFLFTAEEPGQLRGPQFTFVWTDELASWEKLGGDGKTPEAWDQLQFGLRDKHGPCQIVATTTPLPTEFIRGLVVEDGVVVTKSTIFANAHNLSEKVLRKMLHKYESTRLGRQELYGEILTDSPGALWLASWFERPGFRAPAPATLVRVVVAIDPAVTSNPNSDETGIIVAGIDADGIYYVLADYSGNYTAETWAKVATQAYHHHQADIIVGEVNNGGDLIEMAIDAVEGPAVNFAEVRASRGKALRAQPAAALYERGLVRHSGAGLEKLEHQLCTFSPILAAQARGNAHRDDRLDALVWALKELVDNAPSDDGPVGVYGATGSFEDMPLG